MQQYNSAGVNLCALHRTGWALITLQYYAGPVNGGALHRTWWVLTNYTTVLRWAG